MASLAQLEDRFCAQCSLSDRESGEKHRPCSRCKIAFYCSVECQRKHWKEGGHKRHCVPMAEQSSGGGGGGGGGGGAGPR